jgi:hypothetical protein
LTRRVTKSIKGDEYCLAQEEAEEGEILEDEIDEGIVWRGHKETDEGHWVGDIE